MQLHLFLLSVNAVFSQINKENETHCTFSAFYEPTSRSNGCQYAQYAYTSLCERSTWNSKEKKVVGCVLCRNIIPKAMCIVTVAQNVLNTQFFRVPWFLMNFKYLHVQKLIPSFFSIRGRRILIEIFISF